MGSKRKEDAIWRCLCTELASARVQQQQQAALAQLRQIIMELPTQEQRV